MGSEDPRSVDRWRIFRDSVPDFAFILVDLDGNITDWNAGAENLLWYTSDQMVGHSLNLIFTPEDREIGIPEQERAKAMALGRAEDERWHVRSDGSHFRASGTLTTLKDAEAAAILGFAKVLRDVTVREQEREQLERTLRERTTLVKEIQHRVKNNLQMIVSLINLQADRISDAGTLIALQETQNRVRAIAAVHESLYATQDFGTISLGPYLHHLLRDLRSLYDSGNRIRVDLVSDDLALDIRDAIPLALISNELLSNSLRHAFPGGRHGVVTIRLRYVAASDRSTAPEEAELCISDDGFGLPEGAGFFEDSDSTGFELLRLLVAQLHGTMDVESSSAGTSFRISFPLVK